jgi:serine/threonine protein phosphatase Stp1
MPDRGDRPLQYRSWAATHRGAVRPHNEDSFVDRPQVGLWAVADGLGGHEAGEVASAMIKHALEQIPPGLPTDQLLLEVRLRLQETHTALLGQGMRRGWGAVIGSTVAVLVAREDQFACLWAGDSRVYRLRDGALQQLTRDHSLVQDLVDAGTLPADQAEAHPQANIITRAVGVQPKRLDLEEMSGRVQVGDRFLLCSDGVFKALPLPQVAILLAPVAPADVGEDPADRLIAAALAAFASDNVTVVAVDASG